MTQDELQKALEAIGKGGINVNGDLVLEKHVEHEIGNVEAGGIGIQINNGMAPSTKEGGKGNGGRPKRAGTTINKAFIYDAGDETNIRLQWFYRGLLALGWIKADTELKNFLSVFSGKETSCRIIWTGDINALSELFLELIKRRGLVGLPEGESIWVMVNARFWDHEGNREFGNEKLGSTRAPIDSRDDIDLLVEILNPETDLDEVRERLQSQ